MAKKPSIGENPLDSMIPLKRNGNVAVLEEEPQQVKRTIQAKQRITVQISLDIIERLKNAVYWSRGVTLAQFTEEAIEKALLEIEESNVVFDEKTGSTLKKKGQPFPKRKEELKTGRPVN